MTTELCRKEHLLKYCDLNCMEKRNGWLLGRNLNSGPYCDVIRIEYCTVHCYL
jgi:hypothetical protein